MFPNSVTSYQGIAYHVDKQCPYTSIPLFGGYQQCGTIRISESSFVSISICSFKVHLQIICSIYMEINSCFMKASNRCWQYYNIWQTSNCSVIYMSRVVRKPAFCICENKDADQLRGNREADQRLCFRYLDSTIHILPKSNFQASSHIQWLRSPLCVGPGRKPWRLVFSQQGSYHKAIYVQFYCHCTVLWKHPGRLRSDWAFAQADLRFHWALNG